ncbi:fatty acid CoA ligase [Lentzea sp. NBRC 105346]|uniref:class I adenylate-forming enzyme family protein n=1 Tax=Lentzea sp. NBRC 105346 TaxID=3032205 RepID=UPI0024A34EE1|nr:class I adenylate-forming enzyme family protein [Lentzea sp. NBRC 105346]GLZ28398.1 fatty acid CoA ligase [Lentzea sp. NBRC 105346]
MTYVDHVMRVLATEGETEILVCGERRITRAQAREQVLRFADGLHQRGVRPGDGVGVFMGNRPETVLVNLAVHLLGARLVFVPPEPGASELRGLVDHADVKGVVVDPSFDTRLDGWPISELPFDHVERNGVSGYGTVLYTGGTTGLPKLAHHGDTMYETFGKIGQAPTNALISTLLTHGSGHVAAIRGLLSGSKVVLMPSTFDADVFTELVRQEDIRTTALVPPMLYEVLDHPDCPGRGQFDAIRLGGSPVAPARLLQAIERFGPVIWQAYGMSEAGSVTQMDPAWIDPDRPDTLRTCGKRTEWTEVEIRDGDVHVRGPLVMKGYWGHEPVDGWFNTGDVGYFDDEGFLYLVDRSKDVIVTGKTSDNVYSRLLDDFLVTLPGIRQAAAVGVPDDRFGEAVAVFLVADRELDISGLKAAVVEELGELYEPRDVTFVDRLPVTRVGKVDKKALRSTVGQTS